jgi:hypothetical protein
MFKYVSITWSKNIIVNKSIYDQTINQQNFLNMQSIGEVVFYEFEIFYLLMMIIHAKAKETKFPKYMFPKGSQGIDVFDN